MEVNAAINRLEALVEKVDLDINHAMQRLGNKFSETFKDELPNDANPVQLVERWQNITAEYERLTSEIKEIQSEQQTMVSVFCDLFAKPIKTVGDIQLQAGLQPTEYPDEMLVLLNKKCDDEDKENQVQPLDMSDSSKGLNQTALRSESKDLHPITEQELLGLSDLVRGKAKLDDVNKVYETLFEYFKKHPKSLLTVKDMSKMGLKITGTTGGSKLKVLKTLKIIQINKEGSVKMY